MKMGAMPGRKLSIACKCFIHFTHLSYKLGTSTPQMLAHYKKVYYTLVYKIPTIKTLIEDTMHASMLKKMLKKVSICAYIVVLGPAKALF